MTVPDEPQQVDPVRERIVEAFTERARTLGPRAVVMAELAGDLGISTRTLYRHFRSKKDLVVEVMRRLAEETAAQQKRRTERRLSPIERIREVALAWVDGRTRFSVTFWREVEQQYPEAMQVWHLRLAVVAQVARDYLVPVMRDDIPKQLSASILIESVLRASNPERCNQLGLSRQEAVTHAVELWARGGLKRPALTLVPPPEEGADGGEEG